MPSTSRQRWRKSNSPPLAISLGVAEAKRYFDRTPSFAKGKVFDECLKAARAVARIAMKAESARKAKP